jgi:hypothetical protein
VANVTEIEPRLSRPQTSRANSPRDDIELVSAAPLISSPCPCAVSKFVPMGTNGSVIVWDLETVPDIGGPEAPSDQRATRLPRQPSRIAG